ncbi:MAG: DVUA0089 family protein, partial [Thermoguttaceae bacterium]
NSTFTTGVGTVNVINGTTTSTSITGLAANTTYYVRVLAKGNGTTFTDSDYSVSKNVKTQQIAVVVDNVDDTRSTAKNIIFVNDSFVFTDKLGEGPQGAKDVDMYKFEVTQEDVGRTYTFTTSQPNGGLMVDTYLRIFDATSTGTATHLAYNDDYTGGGRYSRVVWTPATPGIYYLGVSTYANRTYNPNVAGSSTGNGTKGDYTLTVSRTELATQSEPGDTISAAQEIIFTNNKFSLTDEIGNGPSGSKDVDMFKLIVSAADLGREYTFTTSQPVDGKMVDTYLRLFNSNGTQVTFNDDYAKTLYSQLVWIPTTAGTYYIGVSSYENRTYNSGTAASGPGGKGGDYTLEVTRTNVSLSKLGMPTLGAVTGISSSAISVAWSAVSNASGYTVQYATNSTFTAGVGTVNITSGVTTSTNISGLSANTTYYVRILAKGNGTTHSDSDYSAAKSTKTEPANTFVDNVGDTRTTAKEISFVNNNFTFTDKLGEGTQAAKDVDMYKFVVAAADIGKTYTFSTSKPDGGTTVDTYLRLLDSVSTGTAVHLAYNDDIASGNRYSQLTWKPTTAGTYYIGVSTYGNRAYNPNIAGSAVGNGTKGDYTLTVTRAGTASLQMTTAVPDVIGNSFENIANVTLSENSFKTTDRIGDSPLGNKEVNMFRLVVTSDDIGRIFTLAASRPDGVAIFDTYLRLFDANGNELAYNDDFAGTRYSQLAYSFDTEGSYYIGVSSYGNRRYDPQSKTCGAGGTTGEYELAVLRGEVLDRLL